ncbi:PLP-dependent transferase [Candidatus Falkowbacteria bacterium]|nr:PLP-dependent transferase [Candidatus Falkowbacteria bacterium]
MNQNTHDLIVDFNRLERLAQSAQIRLQQYVNEVSKSRDHYAPTVCDFLISQAKQLNVSFERFVDEVGNEATRDKEVLSHKLRLLYSQLGATLTMSDWQAPGFESSKTMLMGQQKDFVTPHYKDYQRDLHKTGKVYQKKFVKEYVDSQFHRSPEAFVFSSGQSAYFTTAFHVHIRLEPGEIVVAGKGSYFENIYVLSRLFKDRVVFFDENNIDALVDLVKEKKPRAIFIDTLSNSYGMPAPDMNRLIKEVLPLFSQGSFVVLDNTLLATSFQPLALFPPLQHLRYFIVESLMKYHQFGMDRATGGVVICSEIDGIGMLLSRMHAGTMMPDANVAMMPTPDRALFDERLKRLHRNTQYLAQLLHDHLTKHPHRHISHIVHPQLPNHPSYAWAKDMKFCGSSFAVAFKDKHQHYLLYRMIINRMMRIARRKGVMLSGGTSFGMDATRVYVTARLNTVDVTPFMRVSPGTETIDEIQALGEVLIEALS